MKKSIVAIFGIWVLLYPLACFSSYIIHLKNGRAFTAERYYEEEGQIKFKRNGGIIGIQKDQVKEIEQIEDLPAEKDATVKQDSPATEAETGTQEATEDAAKAEASKHGSAAEDEKNKEKAKESGKGVGQEEAAVKNDAKKDPKIMEEFKTLEQRFESRKNMSINELIELKNALTALRDTIISNYSEEDHSVEIRKIADMRFFLTDLILRKPKNQ